MKTSYQRTTTAKNGRLNAKSQLLERGNVDSLQLADLFPEQAKDGAPGKIIITVSFEPDEESSPK